MHKLSKDIIESMKKRGLNELEIWREYMCRNTPILKGVCHTPDGEIYMDDCTSYKTTCRYKNTRLYNFRLIQ